MKNEEEGRDGRGEGKKGMRERGGTEGREINGRGKRRGKDRTERG